MRALGTMSLKWVFREQKEKWGLHRKGFQKRMLKAEFPSIPPWPSPQFCSFWLLFQPIVGKHNHLWCNRNRESCCLLSPWGDPLHLAEDLLVVKTPQQSACSQPSPSPGDKEVDKCTEGWLGGCGLPPKKAIHPSSAVQSGAPWNVISQWAPCHCREPSVYWREFSTLKVLCAFQKMAAFTLINNWWAQPKPGWSRSGYPSHSTAQQKCHP